MRMLALPLFLAVSATAACAQVPSRSPSGRLEAVQAAPARNDRSDQVDAQAAELRAMLAREVPGLVRHDASADAFWVGMARGTMAAAGVAVDRPQVLVVVDRSPAVQEVNLVLARPDAEWEVLGGARVSTGKPGRREHFKTPVGVFRNSSEILGYRALGTYNLNHIRGNGTRGMRVWDFGWRDTENWRTPGTTAQIRLEMHATDPAVLEPRLGRPDSEGCVRLPSAMDTFIDRHGIIDADYENAARTDRRFAALLSPSRVVTPLAGDKLVVFDSSAPM